MARPVPHQSAFIANADEHLAYGVLVITGIDADPGEKPLGPWSVL